MQIDILIKELKDSIKAARAIDRSDLLYRAAKSLEILNNQIESLLNTMTWKEIKSWATSHGYECKKVSDGYGWKKSGDISVSVSKSVSKLARDIFNHITDNKFLDHQNSYKS